MKQLFALILIITASLFLPGCNNKGSSAPAPLNVNVAAGDTSATLTWDMLSGVNYWVFKAASSDVTPQSCISLPECKIYMKVVSPLVVSGLTNGTTYSFTINGRTDGGAGGEGSPSVQAIPRLAGGTGTWTTGAYSSAGTNNLNGVTYGSIFVAVGNSGALFSSSDGVTWTSLASPLPTNLFATSYYTGNYLAVGANGFILNSTDAATWTQQTDVPALTPNLYAVASNNAGQYIATGAGGTIITSSNAINWLSAISSGTITTQTLKSITYGNGIYVAVGDNGTLIYSTDGSTWFLSDSPPAVGFTINMKSVAYGISNGVGIFVAVGDSGTLITSNDGKNWAPPLSIPLASTINAVTYGRQFIAVENTGRIYTSIDGLTWTFAQTASTPLYAVAHGLYDYSTVGLGGANLHSM